MAARQARGVRRKAPSRVRYEKEHPTISFRVSQDVYRQFARLRAKTGKSIADVFREALCTQNPAADAPYRKGWEAAKKHYRVQYRCFVCGEPIDIESGPSLPAEKVMVMSGLSQIKSSVLALSTVYSPANAAPHELEWMRAPSL